jgi:hypothetical protein
MSVVVARRTRFAAAGFSLLMTVSLAAGMPAKVRATTTTDLTVVPIAQRFAVPQNGDTGAWDCLAASTAMVLEYFENSGQTPRMAIGYAAVALAYRQRQPGGGDLSPSETPAVVEQFTGSLLTVSEGYPPTDDWQAWVSAEIAAGDPMIADIPNWLKLSPPDHHTAEAGVPASQPNGHAIVISGLHDGQVFYEDPWDGKEWSLPVAEFGAAWGPMYGAITFAVTATPGSAPSAAPTAPPAIAPTAAPAATPPPAPAATTTRTILPSGHWITPPNGLILSAPNGEYFAAAAYPTHPGDPAISRVAFTMWWPALGPKSGPWRTACVASVPHAGDVFECLTYLASDGAPFGTVFVSFDVYDMAGNRHLSPDGERTVDRVPAVPQPPTVTPPTVTPPPTPVPTPAPTAPGSACLPLAAPWGLTWTPSTSQLLQAYLNASWMYLANVPDCAPLRYTIYVNGTLAASVPQLPAPLPDITDLGIQYGFPTCLTVTVTDRAGYTSPRSAPLCPD